MATSTVKHIPLNEAANVQAKPTQKTANACQQLTYILTLTPQFDSMPVIWSCPEFPKQPILYSQMLKAAVPLSMLSNYPTSNLPNVKHNCPLHVSVKTPHGVPSSASEAKTGCQMMFSQLLPHLQTPHSTQLNCVLTNYTIQEKINKIQEMMSLVLHPVFLQKATTSTR